MSKRRKTRDHTTAMWSHMTIIICTSKCKQTLVTSLFKLSLPKDYKYQDKSRDALPGVPTFDIREAPPSGSTAEVLEKCCTVQRNYGEKVAHIVVQFRALIRNMLSQRNPFSVFQSRMYQGKFRSECLFITSSSSKSWFNLIYSYSLPMLDESISKYWQRL